jgi:hypothetical protein
MRKKQANTTANQRDDQGERRKKEKDKKRWGRSKA